MHPVLRLDGRAGAACGCSSLCTHIHVCRCICMRTRGRFRCTAKHERFLYTSMRLVRADETELTADPLAGTQTKCSQIKRTLRRRTSSAKKGTSRDHGHTSSVAMRSGDFFSGAWRAVWRAPTSTANSYADSTRSTGSRRWVSTATSVGSSDTMLKSSCVDSRLQPGADTSMRRWS